MTAEAREYQILNERLRERVEVLEGQLAMVEDMAKEATGEQYAPVRYRRALAACDKCKGIPEMSINRCGVCRILQEGL